MKYERKLLKFWAQSFLLGVPKIIVGFRDQQGIVHRMEEVDTYTIPSKVKKMGKGTWDGNICINFAAAFLECMCFFFGGGGLFASESCWRCWLIALLASRAENDHHAGWDVEDPKG